MYDSLIHYLHKLNILVDTSFEFENICIFY